MQCQKVSDYKIRTDHWPVWNSSFKEEGRKKYAEWGQGRFYIQFEFLEEVSKIYANL